MFDIFIKRPILATVVSTLILLLGLKALASLPIRQFPELFNTVITVTTTYPGADADLMQGFITDPIQKAVATADGIDYLTSRSAFGVSVIEVHVRLNEDPNVAMTEVISKVNETRSLLPRGINDPVIEKTTGDDTDVMYLAFSSTVMNPSQITDYMMRDPAQLVHRGRRRKSGNPRQPEIRHADLARSEQAGAIWPFHR